MINTKKVNAVLLALIMVFSMCVPAFASSRVIDGTVYYVCDSCDYASDRKADYNSHVASVHGGDGNNSTSGSSNSSSNSSSTSSSSSSSSSGGSALDQAVNGGFVAANYYECPGCGKRYTSLSDYNDCVDSHNNGVDMHWKTYINQTLPEIFQTLMTYVQYFYESLYNLGFDKILYTNLESFFSALTSSIMAFMDLTSASDSTESDVAGAMTDLESTVNSVDLSGTVLAGFIDTVKTIINTIKQKIKDLYSGNKETTVEITEAEAPAETGSANVGIAVFAAISVAAAAAFVCTKKKA